MKTVLLGHSNSPRLSKNFIVTLTMGMIFGFSFSYFILNLYSLSPQHNWTNIPVFNFSSDDHVHEGMFELDFVFELHFVYLNYILYV